MISARAEETTVVTPNPTTAITISGSIQGTVLKDIGTNISFNLLATNGKGFVSGLENEDISAIVAGTKIGDISSATATDIPIGDMGLKAEISTSSVNNMIAKVKITGIPQNTVVGNIMISQAIRGFLIDHSHIPSDTSIKFTEIAKWDILLEVKFSATGSGKVEAKIDSATPTTKSPVRVKPGDSVQFVLSPNKNQIAISKTTLIIGDSEPVIDEERDLLDPNASKTLYSITVEEGKNIEFKAEFETAPSKYKIGKITVDSLSTSSDDESYISKGNAAEVTPGEIINGNEINMKFGAKSIVIAADAFTIAADMEDKNDDDSDSVEISRKNYYSLAYWGLLNESGENGVKIINPVSTNENIATLERKANGDFILTAQGEGTVTIKVTASHDTTVTGTTGLEDGILEFKVIVEAADTPLTLSDDETNTIIAWAAVKGTEDESGAVDIDENVGVRIKLNFNNETIELVSDSLPDDYKDSVLAGYSINGTSWSSLPEADENGKISIEAVFNKTMSNLKFTTALEKNKPVQGAIVWTIGKVASRPATPKLKVFYPADTADNINMWTVTGATDLSKLMVTTAFGNKKTPDRAENIFISDVESWEDWETFDSAGYPVAELPETDKVAYAYYIAKTAPVIGDNLTDPKTRKITPASKIVKLKVSSEIKPPKVTVDYKKEIVKMKANYAYRMWGEETDAVILNKTNAKAGIKFKDLFGMEYKEITETNLKKEIEVYIAATGKKPRSTSIQVIVNGPKAFEGLPESGFDSYKHKYKLPKGLEVWDKNKSKWVTSIKITGNITLDVRERGKAKYDASDSEANLKAGTRTASIVKKYDIIWGEYNTTKLIKGTDDFVKKQGVLEVREVN
jgi:hypothetical protein